MSMSEKPISKLLNFFKNRTSWFRSYIHCDRVCQNSSNLIGLLSAQIFFLVPTSTMESVFGKAGFYENEVKKMEKRSCII